MRVGGGHFSSCLEVVRGRGSGSEREGRRGGTLD